MNKLLSFSLPLAIAAALTTSAIAQTATIPANQQQSPAGVDSVPYRPACSQLGSQLSADNPAFRGWGAAAGDSFAVWYGLPADMSAGEAVKQLAALGLCVEGGAIVPLSIASATTPTTAATPTPITAPAEGKRLTPLEENLQRNREKLERAQQGEGEGGSGGVVFFLIVGLGGFFLYEKYEKAQEQKRLEEGDREPVQYQAEPRRRAEGFGSVQIPDRASSADLHSAQLGNQLQRPVVPVKKRTALEVLLASPFISRAVYGAQRSGKSNLIASAAKELKASRGVKFFVLNLGSYGPEDSVYWADAQIVRGDLVAVSDEQAAAELITQAEALVTEFINYSGPAVLVCDEWAFMGAKHGKHSKALSTLIQDLANKITGLSSSGMKRRKAVWTIAPDIVAGELEDFAKAVKKLKPCLVAIAPGHSVKWEGDEITFSRELYSQVNTNYPGALVEPPEGSKDSRIACIDGEWLALGTRALVPAGGVAEPKVVDTLPAPVDSFPKPLELSPELQAFHDWLNKKAGEVIDYNGFNNANCFRQISRSKENYLKLCDKAIIKGWLSQRGEETFFVFE